jgi:hypothetical protein
VLAGRAVPVPEVDAVGCLIDFPERDRRAAHTQISYAERIAPLLASHQARRVELYIDLAAVGLFSSASMVPPTAAWKRPSRTRAPIASPRWWRSICCVRWNCSTPITRWSLPSLTTSSGPLESNNYLSCLT